MRKLLWAIFCSSALLGNLLHAQSPAPDSWASLYFDLSENPAYAGSQKDFSVRYQATLPKVGLGGHRYQQSLSVGFPLEKIKSGIGVYFRQDRFTGNSVTDMGAAYNFNFELGADHSLRVGAAASVWQYTRLPYLFSLDTWDPAQVDPVGTGSETFIGLDLHPGIWYRNGDLFAGVSMNYLFTPEIGRVDPINRPQVGSIPTQFHAKVGYRAKVSPSVTLVPYLEMRYRSTILIYEAAVLGLWKERWGLGTSVTQNEIRGQAVFNWKMLRFAYVYGYETSPLWRGSLSTHSFNFAFTPQTKSQ